VHTIAAYVSMTCSQLCPKQQACPIFLSGRPVILTMCLIPVISLFDLTGSQAKMFFQHRQKAIRRHAGKDRSVYPYIRPFSTAFQAVDHAKIYQVPSTSRQRIQGFHQFPTAQQMARGALAEFDFESFHVHTSAQCSTKFYSQQAIPD